MGRVGLAMVDAMAPMLVTQLSAFPPFTPKVNAHDAVPRKVCLRSEKPVVHRLSLTDALKHHHSISSEDTCSGSSSHDETPKAILSCKKRNVVRPCKAKRERY